MLLARYNKSRKATMWISLGISLGSLQRLRTSTRKEQRELISSMEQKKLAIKMSAQKGQEIRFIRGKYQGQTGWVNAAKKKTKKGLQPVIVKMDNGVEKQTRVKVTSFRTPFSAANNYAEAALQQHPDMELAMIKLAESVAECGLRDINEMLVIFEAEIERAKFILLSKGSSARYRIVTCDADYPAQAEDVVNKSGDLEFGDV